MSWNELRAQWQRAAPAAEVEAAETPPVSNLRKRAARLRRTVTRRDRRETVAALVLLPLIGWWAWLAWSDAAGARLGFTILLGTWAAWLPGHLKRARRQLPNPAHDQPVLTYLTQQRDALLIQARMLERVWCWYLLPPLIGLSGMVLSETGFTPFALGLVAVYVTMAAVIYALNRHAARTVFRRQATEIDQQLRVLRDQA